MNTITPGDKVILECKGKHKWKVDVKIVENDYIEGPYMMDDSEEHECGGCNGLFEKDQHKLIWRMEMTELGDDVYINKLNDGSFELKIINEEVEYDSIFLDKIVTENLIKYLTDNK